MRRSCRLKQLSGGPSRELPCHSAVVPPARAEQAQTVVEKTVPTRELESGLWARGFLRVAGGKASAPSIETPVGGKSRAPESLHSRR